MQLLLDTENSRLLSPPGAGIPSSWKTSLSAFLGHHSTSQSPCRISSWHPAEQNSVSLDPAAPQQPRRPSSMLRTLPMGPTREHSPQPSIQLPALLRDARARPRSWLCLKFVPKTDSSPKATPRTDTL